MAIVSVLMSATTIVFYFFLSLFMPFLFYLIPYYKITRVNLYKKKYSLAVNIIVSVVLFAINPSLLIIYLIFPYAIEFMFYLLNRIGRRWQVYNRIVIMSIVPTIFVFGYFYMLKDEMTAFINILPHIEELVQKFGIEKVRKTQEVFIAIKDYSLFWIFQCIFFTSFFLFLSLIPNTYKLWRISCYWIIPYIIILWLQEFTNISYNVFLENNILEIIKWIFIWYGIKNIYNLSEKLGVKSNILRHSISILVGLTYPMVTFIIGALASFEFIEVKQIRI